MRGVENEIQRDLDSSSLKDYFKSLSKGLISNPADNMLFSNSLTDDYIDPTLSKYMGFNQIHNYYTGKNYLGTPVTVIVFDHLVDFTHEAFERIDGTSVIDKIVTIDNEGDILEYNPMDYPDENPFHEDSIFYDYIAYGGQDGYGHGTHVAGIIHQIAPDARIISVAHKAHSTAAQILSFVTSFLEWLEDQIDDPELKIVNISEGWEDHIISDDREGILDLIFKRLLQSGNFFFTTAAGNKESKEDNDWNLIYPASLANNWETEPIFRDYEIEGILNQNNIPIFCNGFVSVSSIYDELPNDAGLRNEEYVYDNDNDGDLKLVAPGFNILSTYPTSNIYDGDTHATYMTGTSMAAPVVAGIAALLQGKKGYSGMANSKLEQAIIESAIYDSNVPYDSDIEEQRVERLQKYGLGMVNPLKLLGLENSEQDSDGILDIEELYTYHTDPNKEDTDEDGLWDNEELFVYFTDPNNPDSDYDGLVDGEEINTYNTDPIVGDTDGDWLLDGWEADTQIYDPTLSDTDGDGTLDRDEDYDGDGLTNFEEMTYCTSFDNWDTDGDFLPDWDEIHLTETDPLDADSDNDNLSEYWEVQYGLDPNTANTNEDPDGDGLTNLEEYNLQTNPMSADTDGDGMPDNWEIDNGFNPLLNDATSDADLDGLTNYEEYQEGTNPHNNDSDNDGMKDGWEVDNNLLPLINDAQNDADGDGLTNIDEYLNNCNPRDTDTDNDGLNDKLEVVNYNTNPNVADTDGDGWTDYYEVYTSGTNPTKADTDNDGISDKNEYYWWINTYGQSSSSARSKIKIRDVDSDGLTDGYEKSHALNPLDNDCDNDGLLDGLEVNTYHTNPKDSDSDNDGYSDLTEVINGTDPNDSSDYPGSGGFGW